MSEPATLREQDIRPPALMEAKQEAVETDRRFLLEHREAWIRVACPACGEDRPERWGEKDGFTYDACTGCGTVYTSPRPTEALLARFYAGSANYAWWNDHVFPATESVRRERIFRPRAERLREIATRVGARPGTLLDVGAAFGTFCGCAVDTGLATRAIALEPTPGLAETCRRRGFEVIESPIEAVETEAVADIVTAYEVIEHVFDPAAFIAAARRLVRPGGLIVLSCPNIRGFGIAELGVASGSVDHEHLNYFHPGSLARLVTAGGLELIETLTPGRLDVDLVRQAHQRGEVDVRDRPWLAEILDRRAEELAEPFQDFLAEHGLSSHLWLVARRPASG
jgi:2-polyprenyl-3-methyl-5-hydroxy-6-metoxy-1,4-benzoquinol methylase